VRRAANRLLAACAARPIARFCREPTKDAMRRKFILIANAGAGLAGSPLVDQVALALTRSGATVARERPPSFEAARQAAGEAAASRRYDAIVAAGGDGTIRQVAAVLIDAQTPLGIVPVGTGNVLAHEIGLVPSVEAITHMLLYGTTCAVSCARANGEPFLLMAGAGFDGRVIAALDHRFKSYLGKVAYAGPVLGALVRPIDTLSVTIDGRRHEASWAVIANARHYGGRFVMAPRTGIQERGLQAILFKARNRAVLIGQLMALVSGTLDTRAASHGDVEMLACTRASISAPHPVPTQIDGDAFGSTPLEVEAGAGDLQLIVPDGRPSRQSR
jgi:diacylglycerol kinase family enzyme